MKRILFAPLRLQIVVTHRHSDYVDLECYGGLPHTEAHNRHCPHCHVDPACDQLAAFNSGPHDLPVPGCYRLIPNEVPRHGGNRPGRGQGEQSGPALPRIV